MRRVLGWLAGALLAMTLLMTAFSLPLAAGEVTADQLYIHATMSPAPVVVSFEATASVTGHVYCEFNVMREIPEYAAADMPNTEERSMRTSRPSSNRASSRGLPGPGLYSALAGKSINLRS